MRPAARISDMHMCPMLTPGTPPIPHVGGPISKGAATVMIGFMPAARAMDMAICVGPPDMIAMGSPTVFIEYMMAARMGDPTIHGGAVTIGFPTVLIGDVGMGGAVGGGGPPGAGGAPGLGGGLGETAGIIAGGVAAAVTAAAEAVQSAAAISETAASTVVTAATTAGGFVGHQASVCMNAAKEAGAPFVAPASELE